MSIENLTIKEARELATMFGAQPTKKLPLKVGEQLFVWTVTAHYTGRVTAISEDEIELSDAAWIASDGRVADALQSGVFDEVEPLPEPIVLNRGSFLHYQRFPHQLPRSQK